MPLAGVILNDTVSQNVNITLEGEDGVGHDDLTTTPRTDIMRIGMDFRATDPDVANISAVEKPVTQNMTINPEGDPEWWYTRTVTYPVLNDIGNATSRKFCYYMNHIVTLGQSPATSGPTVDPSVTVVLQRYDPKQMNWVEEACNWTFDYVNTRTSGKYYGTLGVTVIAALILNAAYRMVVTSTRSVARFTRPLTGFSTSGAIAMTDGLVY